MSRLFTFLNQPIEEDVISKCQIDEVRTIEFDHVQFGYDDNLLMKDVNIDVHQGQTIAIVGPTGCLLYTSRRNGICRKSIWWSCSETIFPSCRNWTS